ncbi:uncharacterized protein BDZ99DRAFT_65716 [Mytilinidion resinicola]|uniref:WIBG Mago-binding domain-containing protein n=1 Tax=Mytilinidion resinicola TaxID=574789 RepID=A0A6A6YIM2_9PEZI|nr:uncharacterized protein BDZ99DRAFT_65716 [Mytilinidion resinicola]KAF2807777.1 hypothetical protein BDZ99DRAFT_65716 [Mytilinidion resinicola]
MPTVPTTLSSSKSGITTSETGERHIPSSTRPDGSVRKEIRVRPGYRPPEDVEVYKNRTAEAWKTRGSEGVPGAEPLVKKAAPVSGTVNKNAKRREARKRAAADGIAGEGSTDGDAAKPADGKGVQVEELEPPKEVDLEVEKEKEARKLMKKLRQARELKDKKEKGDTLLPEQFEKVIKINELIRLLDNLGFDGEGVRKDGHESNPDR